MHLAVEVVCVGGVASVCRAIVAEDLDSSEASAGPLAMTTSNGTIQSRERLAHTTVRVGHRFPVHGLHQSFSAQI